MKPAKKQVDARWYTDWITKSIIVSVFGWKYFGPTTDWKIVTPKKKDLPVCVLLSIVVWDNENEPRQNTSVNKEKIILLSQKSATLRLLHNRTRLIATWIPLYASRTPIADLRVNIDYTRTHAPVTDTRTRWRPTSVSNQGLIVQEEFVALAMNGF